MGPPDELALIAYDGSSAAQHAVAQAARLLSARRVVVVTVWEEGLAFVAPPPEQVTAVFDISLKHVSGSVPIRLDDFTITAGTSSTPTDDGTLGTTTTSVEQGAPITFDYARTSFTPIGEQAVRELADALREQRPARIRLVGHTDVRGSEETNKKLSAARAEADPEVERITREVDQLLARRNAQVDFGVLIQETPETRHEPT